MSQTLVAEKATTPPILPTKNITASLAFLSGCIALMMTGFGIIIPIFPQRLEALGLGAGTLALMEGGFGLGMFLFSTPMGTLADRIGRKPVIFLSLAGFILTNVVLAFVNIPLVFILIRFVEGALVSGLMPAATAMVGDSVPAEKQGRWLGMITTAQATGIALGPGIGGILYQIFGFSIPFLICAGIALAASLLAYFMLPETLPASVRERNLHRQLHKETKTKVGRSVFFKLVLLILPLLIIDLGLTFVYPFVLPQYPFYLVNTLHYTPAEYGLIVSIYGLSLAVFPLFLGRLSETSSKKLLIIVGSLLFPVLNIAMLILHQYILLILAAAVTGIADALLLPALGGLYLAQTTDENRSQLLGIRGSAISLGILFGPLTQALVAPWITPEITFAIGIAIPLAIAVLAIFMLKNPQPGKKLAVSSKG